jgi:phosphotransferase system enzyme I (PtsI)
VELKGIGVSPGLAVGPALVVEREAIPILRLSLAPGDVEAEVERLQQAVAASRRQLQGIRQRLSREVGMPHAYIFDAHLLMLEDPLLLDRALLVIRSERANAEWALRSVADQLRGQFARFGDAYLRERSSDLDDVLGRIQLNLAGAADAPRLSQLPGSFVVVAEDLTPSQAAELDWERVLALAMDAGSSTYHTSILARSFGIPGVVGLQDATRRIPPGALVVVDGSQGRVVVEPSGLVLEGVRARRQREHDEQQQLQDTRALPALTRDGVSVSLQANVEFLEEAATAAAYGAQGIGLFRSEYLLGRSGKWPSEERQIEIYRRLIDQMRPWPVTVRTWDVGAEELAPGGPSCPNPALSERALRLLHRAPEPFRVQLRALLRSAAHGPLRVMLPFVAGPADLRAALDLIDEIRGELRAEGVAFREDVPVGLNVEIPSAALSADLLAPQVAFFSVGTNDLIQYLLAVDRMDPRVSALYEPLHPAVLRTLRSVVAVAQAEALPVSVCGEMASDPLHALLLLGLGVRELSMSPAAIPRVKAALRGVRAERAREVALHCLELATAGEIEALVRRELAEALDPLRLQEEHRP